MSFDIEGYYSQYPTQIEGVFQDGFNHTLDTGDLEGYDGDVSHLGEPTGQLGANYYWETPSAVLVSDDYETPRLVVRQEANRLVFTADTPSGWVQYMDLTSGGTYVEDVLVIGQRRDFPSQYFPIPNSTAPGGGIPFNPCSSASTAVPWNADAAAVTATADFLQAASNLGFSDAPGGNPTLANREFGKGLALRPDNSVWGNDPSWGSPVNPPNPSGMTINFAGITNATYIGDVHTHPNGNSLPSIEDWNGFLANNRAARIYGRTNETFYMYIAVIGSDGQVAKYYVYEDGPRAANSPDPQRPTSVGSEVNPNAQPCP